MKQVFVTDVSLRSKAAKNGRTMTFRDKTNVAVCLDQIGIDAIELAPVENLKEDSIIYRTIAGAVKNAMLCLPAGTDEESIKDAFGCIATAVKPCLQIMLPVSTVQMEYTYHLKADKMLAKISDLVKFAASICPNVEFVALDATRAEEGFLLKCCQAVKDSGATCFSICDDAGVMLPEDWAPIIKELKQVPDIYIHIQPNNNLKMAAADAVSAIQAGADGIKTSIFNGELLSAETFAEILRIKGDDLGITSKLNTAAIHKAVSEVVKTRIDADDVDASNVEDGLVSLEIDSSIETVSDAVKSLGYDISAEDLGKVYAEYQRVSAKKGVIGARELDAIIASTAMQIPSSYHVNSYVVNSGNVISAMAQITLDKDGELVSGVGTGDGPIDAAFSAIEQIIGHHYELDEFRIQAVTEGHAALGSSIIRLRANGKLYAGTGLSTDIVGACIRAYINALNKIVYEEN